LGPIKIKIDVVLRNLLSPCHKVFTPKNGTLLFQATEEKDFIHIFEVSEDSLGGFVDELEEVKITKGF